MTPGKMASQACHAAKNCVLIAHNENPKLLQTYQGPDFIGTQIVLKAKNLRALEEAYARAQEEGLITNLIIDKNHVIPGTAFTGDPIVTALGIGPCTKEEAHAITKRFGVVQ